MTAIAAISRGVQKTMADGTLRFVIEVPPNQRNEAFALLGMPDSPIAVVRLTQEASLAHAQAETVAGNADVPAADEKPKGGDLARLAGLFCNSAKFYEWAGVADEKEAKEFICTECGVTSRAYLDHIPDAAQAFHRNVRLPFLAWQEGRA